MFASQPSEAIPLQLTKPASQAAMVHCPDEQDSVALGRLQTVPQAPQFEGSEARDTQAPLHSVVPAGQARAQAPPVHTLPASHTAPHAPQLSGSVKVLTSHPSDAVLLQSAKPAVQPLTVHCESAHPAVALARLQTFAQPPQLFGSVARETSQPSTASMLQSANPPVHAAIAQVPVVHWAVALAGAHTLPQPPQFATSDSSAISHPSAAETLQSAYPWLQPPMAQMPASQDGRALAGAQTEPQAPQLNGSAAISTSQPSTRTPLQSAHPMAQEAIPQVLAAHCATAWGGAQTWPQAPQLAVSLATLTSQPSEAIVLQSSQPERQDATVHWELTQAATPLAAEHTVAQPPQCAGSEVRSTQEPLHSLRPPVQLAAHTPLLHTWPARQAVAQVPQ